MQDNLTPDQKTNNGLNYSIVSFFLKNNRLTILCLAMLVIMGLATTFLLKTTGFPNPEIKIAFIQTIYPGASSKTVMDEVTIPLENAVKNVEGVQRFSSNSGNSFSIITLNLQEKVDTDSTINKINTAISSVNLPDSVKTPTISKPSVGSVDLILAISSDNKEKLYNISSKIKNDLTQLEAVSNITSPSELKKFVLVKIDTQKALQNSITTQTIESQIKTLGESIPVISGVEIDNKSTSILTTVAGNDLDALKKLTFSPATSNPTASSSAPNSGPSSPSNNQANNQPTNPISLTLEELAQINFDYRFERGDPVYGFNQEDTSNVIQTQYLYINGVANTDQSKFVADINSILDGYDKDQVSFSTHKETNSEFNKDKVNVIEIFSTNDQNQEQVSEVVGGLVGGPLKIENKTLAQIGWLLGGIQLVVLVMMAFVSWRAAIIAGAAIPLSLFFTTIYLYITGESLNTLVLFSLVLVIGLVVDPALVILESIQRKIDIGLSGNEAVLAAVKDVGKGIFLAALTNIIVFAPFGVLSGFLGQIFAYIPLTIVPATVGSYVVPLVFLAWLGGLILKPNKNNKKLLSEISDTTTAEKELDKLEIQNMWKIAKFIKNINYKILQTPFYVRFIIIALTLIFSLAIAGFYTSTEQVKTTTFAVNENAPNLLLNATHRSESTQSQKSENEKQVVQELLKYKEIKDVYPFGRDSSYRIGLNLENKSQDQSSLDLAKNISKDIEAKFGSKFFDIKVDIERTGPPTPQYQLSTAIYTNNLDLSKKAALDVRAKMLDLCKNKDNTVSINTNCNNEDGKKLVTKVDDGFTDKNNNTIEVLLDRQKLAQNQAIIPNAPLSILANRTIASLYQYNNGESLINLKENNEIVGVRLENTTATPKTIDEIKNISIFTLSGKAVKLGDIANINQSQPPQNISRSRGRNVILVQARLNDENADNQAVVQQASQVINNFYLQNDSQKATDLGLEKKSIGNFSDGSSSDTLKTFQELLFALVISIFLSYLALVLFFRSFTQPLAIIYTVPLTFIGVYPALAYFGGGQIGFLEIIGIIILVGIVENVAIFLIDFANQKIDEGMDPKVAISYAAGIRFKPVMLTSLTAVASLMPLAIFSVFYRSIAVVIMSGILVSGIISLITTPILFIFFRWLSFKWRGQTWYNKILFFPFFPIYLIYWSFLKKNTTKA